MQTFTTQLCALILGLVFSVQVHHTLADPDTIDPWR